MAVHSKLEDPATVQTRYFERPEGVLAYSDYGGDGELALMLPGMGALRSEYRFLAPQLRAAGYRAITVDLRGQGESSAPWSAYDVPSVGGDILALIAHLNAGPAHVIGTSFAPAAAVWAAVEKPDAIRSLVLISPFAREVKINPFMRVVFGLMLNNPWRVQTWGMFYNSMYPTRKPADFVEYKRQLLANLAEPGRFDALKGFGNAPRQPSEERFGRLHTPALVVMGTKDADFPDPVGEARYLAEQTRGVLALIEDAGHYPQTEMPEQVAPVVLDFLKAAVRS
jgi:pimeloyl-ACP methyl ester carboxylesterase